MRIVLDLIVAIAATCSFLNRRDTEKELQLTPLAPGKRTCIVAPLMLPMVLGGLLGMVLILAPMMSINTGEVLGTIAKKLVQLFCHISIYYALLLLVLPLLRNIFSAGACAVLWLIPTLLYLCTYMWGNEEYYELPAQIVLPFPRRYLLPALVVWVCGFIGIMGGQILTHIRLRRFLLRSGVPLQDFDILQRWQAATRYHGIKREIPILVTEAVGTPLTIGCFERTMYLVLPQCSYTAEEWDLIFRHELRHIVRCDSQTKLFLGFCAAMCWFNPLGWLACKKAAEDFELSCDEAVLEGESAEVRRQYAQLLLKSAAPGWGYTTCLSSAASTLRYRLRRVVRPVKRLAGGLAVGVAAFGLTASLGFVALKDGPGLAQNLIFYQAPEEIIMSQVLVQDWNQPGESVFQIYKYDASALTQYLASLTVEQVYVGYCVPKKGRQLQVEYEELTNGKVASITHLKLSDGLLFVDIPYDNRGDIAYLVEEKIDWDYLDSLLEI
ncbi:MAG: M56 family metallopeptidase [Lawsonibacter sp.]|jgi:hypothetical protein